ELRIVEVQSVEREAPHVVELVTDRCRDIADTVLREGRETIEAAEERGAVRVRHARIEMLVFVVAAQVERVLRRADQRSATLFLAVRIGVVRGDAEVLPQRLLVGELEAFDRTT